MMNANNKKSEEALLMKFLDNDLSPEDERKALHVIAEDEEMRSMLKFDRTLNNSLAGKQELYMSEVPDGFTDQVMSRIERLDNARNAELDESSVWSELKQWFDSLIMPRELRYRPVVAYLFIVILAVGFGYFTDFNSGANTEIVSSQDQDSDIQLASATQSEESIWIRFIYIDEDASDIAVAGDFSDWEPISLEKQLVDGKQLWSGLVPITKGEHKYMFVKDGEEWLTDPLAEVKRDDGFGNKNAVIVL